MTYTVVPGDSLWKIASKYQVGISELIAANPQINDPSLIFPGDTINIPQGSQFATQEDEVIRLVNVERTNRGLRPLTKNWELSRVARYKSEDMAKNNYFDHNSPTYGSPANMIRNFGIRYNAMGENIAYGQTTPASVMNSWMNSAGHRNNILSPNFTQIGVGLAKNSRGTPYWTQMFIG